MPSPLAIEVETKARRLMADIQKLAELTTRLDDDEKESISKRLQPDMDDTEKALTQLFPGLL